MRRQEAELSRQKVEESNRKKMKSKEEEHIEEMKQEYLRKLKLLEELKKAKEIGQVEIGNLPI